MMYYKDIEKFTNNKTVFCGIDVHLKHWNLCYICDGEVLEKTRIEGAGQILIDHTQNYYGKAHQVQFVYEAGFSGFSLYRALKRSGYECMITPPSRVPSLLDKVKTDKRDAQKLAQYLAGGLLKSIFVPPASVESERKLLRMRHSTQKKLTRTKNQIKSMLNLYDIRWPEQVGNKWTKRYLAWLENN